MPLVKTTYKPPFWMRNGHIATIYPSMFRKVEGVEYTRERIYTTDGDFLDLDWSQRDSKNLIVVSHGLEGSSNRPYVRGMVKYFNEKGWDALAWNCRSCSGEINKTARFYHHGATGDLKLVIDHINNEYDYESIWLIGFSMGGSLSIKYLGENGSEAPSNLKGAVAYSIPVSLRSSVEKLSNGNIKFYEKRFLKKLGEKVRIKAERYPDLISHQGFEEIKTFNDFDNRYTAPLHGFKNADDFYDTVAAGNFMQSTDRPILICNALNDPFLGEACYPYQECETHELLYFESPEYGGHVGFTLLGNEYNYMEKRAWDFINALI